MYRWVGCVLIGRFVLLCDYMYQSIEASVSCGRW
jgi:hypothetical protein